MVMAGPLASDVAGITDGPLTSPWACTDTGEHRSKAANTAPQGAKVVHAIPDQPQQQRNSCEHCSSDNRGWTERSLN